VVGMTGAAILTAAVVVASRSSARQAPGTA